jgi:hypothetical protein
MTTTDGRKSKNQKSEAKFKHYITTVKISFEAKLNVIKMAEKAVKMGHPRRNLLFAFHALLFVGNLRRTNGFSKPGSSVSVTHQSNNPSCMTHQAPRTVQDSCLQRNLEDGHHGNQEQCAQNQQRQASMLLSSTAAIEPVSLSDNDVILEPLGTGIRRDFSRRFTWPMYKSDIKDGVNAQSFAVTMFLFFACLAPAIGFGGILDVATQGSIGVIEMISSTALCGVLYALLAPQPV